MPDEITTYIMLGNIYFNKNNYLDALLEYQKILWLYPQDLYALYQQAICFYRLEYYREILSKSLLFCLFIKNLIAKLRS